MSAKLYISNDTATSEYELIEQVGQGSEAQVYKAAPLASGRSLPSPEYVAVKAFRAPTSEEIGHSEHERIIRSRIFSDLPKGHPFLIDVLDGFEGFAPRPRPSDTRERRFYLIMRWVDGISFAEYSRRSPGNLRPLYDAAQGLAALHTSKLIHGDVKPAHILVDVHGRGQVADLGSVRRIGDTITSGTPRYSSRSLSRGASIGMDIYALATVAAEALLLAVGRSDLAPEEDAEEVRQLLACRVPEDVLRDIFDALASPMAEADIVQRFSSFETCGRLLPVGDGSSRERRATEPVRMAEMQPTARFDAMSTRLLGETESFDNSEGPRRSETRQYGVLESLLFDAHVFVSRNLNFTFAAVLAVLLGVVVGAGLVGLAR